MKPAGKYIAALIMVGLMPLASGSAQAGPYHHGYRHGPGPYYWVAPAIAGGLLTYAFIQPRVVYAQPPVVVAPPPAVISPPVVMAPGTPGAVYYFCDSARNYYPYAQACPEGWKVMPVTPVH